MGPYEDGNKCFDIPMGILLCVTFTGASAVICFHDDDEIAYFTMHWKTRELVFVYCSKNMR